MTPALPTSLGGGSPLNAPPAQPPGMPTASALGQPAPGGGKGPGQMGSLPRLGFEVEQSLRTIAKVIGPELAPRVEEIITSLKDLLVQALDSGPDSTKEPSGGPF